ncbi:MAG: D-alanine--D-alanine ligase family protein [Anaerovoracaceae bacterium]
MSNDKSSVAVIFGGQSSEHEVSCLSAASVINHLDTDKYKIHKIGITKQGDWFLTNALAENILDGSWIQNESNQRAALSLDRVKKDLLVFDNEGGYFRIDVDVIFPVLHGKNGEDGTIQGLFDLSGIPYVGPGTRASATCMDKAITKLMVGQIGVKQADSFVVTEVAFERDQSGVVDKGEKYFKGKYPLFVKPSSAGSSVGISKARDKSQLAQAIITALKEDDKVLVEETIVGREIEVAVLGNEDPKASPIGEIIAANEFYDYDAKYINGESKTRVITDLLPEKEKEIQEAAVKVFECMGCRGLSRVDFFLDDEGTVVFNEINTMPGFTNISMYPQLWLATGMTYDNLLNTLIALALENSN